MNIDAVIITLVLVGSSIIMAVIAMHAPDIIRRHCDTWVDEDRVHDENLIHKAWRVAKSAKTPEQIERSTQYLKLANDQLRTSYGKWLLKILLDELVADVNVECCDRCCQVYEASLTTCPYCEEHHDTDQ